LAGVTQGLSGFGSVLLSLPLLALLIDIKTVIPLVALFAMVLTIILLIQLWAFIDWRKVYPLLIGALGGIPVGVFFLKKMDKNLIQGLVGITLIIFSLYSLWYGTTFRTLRRQWGIVFGFLAGCLGGAITASGPPVIVYTSMQPWGKDAIKATLQGFFFLAGLVIVISHAISGITTVTVLRYFVVSVPFLIAGTYVGSFFYGMIEESVYKKILFILLAILGAFMIFKATPWYQFLLKG